MTHPRDWLPPRPLAKPTGCKGFHTCCFCATCHARQEAIHWFDRHAPGPVKDFHRRYLRERDSDWHLVSHDQGDHVTLFYRAGEATTDRLALHVTDDAGSRPWEIRNLHRLAHIDPDPNARLEYQQTIDTLRTHPDDVTDLATIARQRDRRALAAIVRDITPAATADDKAQVAQILTAVEQDQLAAPAAKSRLGAIRARHNRERQQAQAA